MSVLLVFNYLNRRPDFLAEAARKAVDQGADTIDI